MIDLTGHVALVTGSSRGIGRACALKLAQAGADVVVNYLTSRAAADQVAAEISQARRRTAVVKADVGEPEDVESMIGFIREHFGRLDILVSNAATGGFRPLIATTPRHFEAAMKTNAQALLSLVQSALPLLERSSGRAKVISLSSHGSHRALPAYGAIGASKAALESLTRHLALELGGRGINFNVVQAGLVETDSFLQMPNRERLREARQARSLTGERVLTVEDVAAAVTYLASPLSDLVQGHTLVVDGGAAVLP
ncbi:MAG: SDR family oxidoreductase [Planctomycetaceae bacterium]